MLGAKTLLARGGMGVEAPIPVGSDGRFCVEVTLLPDSPNSVAFTPLDHNGCPGIETVITISHKTTAVVDGGISSPINVSENTPLRIKDEDHLEENSLENINDGKESTFATLAFWDLIDNGECDEHTWIAVDLLKTYTISKVKLFWASNVDKSYATCYSILLSESKQPENPDPSSPDWNTVLPGGNVSNGDERDQVHSINPQGARWAALLLYEDGETYLKESFKLAEFQVWGQDPNAVPPPPPDRCE